MKKFLLMILAVSSFSAMACDYTSLMDKLNAKHTINTTGSKERAIGVTLLDWSEGVKAIFDVHWKKKSGDLEPVLGKTTYEVDLGGELCTLKNLESMRKHTSSHSCALEGIKNRLHTLNADSPTGPKVIKWTPGSGGKIAVSKKIFEVKVDGMFCLEKEI